MARLDRHPMNPQPPTDAAKPRRRYAPRMAPEKRREQLIDAALNVIVEQGYEGVSIESIARMAGVTRPVISAHFSSLGRLLQALIEREEAYALAQLDDVVPPAPQAVGDAPAMFAAGVRRFLDAVASRPTTWRVILLPPEGTPAIVRAHVETNRARLLARLTEFVALAVQRSEIPADLDIEICGRAIPRLRAEGGREVLADPERFSPDRSERFARTIMELIWSGGR